MISCCSCKKEYDFEGNIFKVDKNTNCPILICPHCGFKHAINFMPFENKIENLKKIEKIELGLAYPLLGASRIANASRVDVSDGDDADVKNGVAWDISTFVYAKKFYNLNNEDSQPLDFFFSPDGLKMFMLGRTSHKVFQYSLSVAWNVSTASYSEIFKDISGITVFPSSITFSPNGLIMYILDSTTNAETIYQFTLSTAWNVGTATYADKSFPIRNVAVDPEGIFIHPSGTYMYVVADPGNLLYQLTLTTPWDISTAEEYKNYNLTPEGITPRKVFFKSDGLKFYSIEDAVDAVFQYSLSVAWNVSTASYSGKYKSVAAQDIWNKGIFLNPDGVKMYHIGGTTTEYIYQYELSKAWNKTNDFILATRIYGSKGAYNFAYKLRWRDVTAEGTFADVGATGEISFSADTVLVDGQALAIGNKICSLQSGYSWQNGMESEGDNILPDAGTYSLADEYYTELQWALDCSNAIDEHEYEFALFELTNGTSIGTCLASITMAITIVGGLSMKWNGVAISKWNGVVIDKLNGVD